MVGYFSCRAAASRTSSRELRPLASLHGQLQFLLLKVLLEKGKRVLTEVLSPHVTIMHGDYRNAIDSINFDAIICDPPYGIAYIKSKQKVAVNNIAFSTVNNIAFSTKPIVTV